MTDSLKIIVFVLIIFIVLSLIGSYLNRNEQFYPYYGGNYCDKCDDKNKAQCMGCLNCGYCVKNGRGECVPGQITGPDDKKDCASWIYVNQLMWSPPTKPRAIIFDV
jgi:hypothetical protein